MNRWLDELKIVKRQFIPGIAATYLGPLLRTHHGVEASGRTKDPRRCDSSGEAGESELEGLDRRPAQYEDA